MPHPANEDFQKRRHTQIQQVQGCSGLNCKFPPNCGLRFFCAKNVHFWYSFLFTSSAHQGYLQVSQFSPLLLPVEVHFVWLLQKLEQSTLYFIGWWLLRRTGLNGGFTRIYSYIHWDSLLHNRNKVGNGERSEKPFFFQHETSPKVFPRQSST